jgi:hypothetical protein
MTGARPTTSPGKLRRPTSVRGFAAVRAAGLELPGVQAGVKYDGSPVLTLGGCFVAGLAAHSSAEPDTLVVRITGDDRDRFLAEAPDAYYLTDYYARHPVVLVRLSRVGHDALRDLLSMSWRLTAAKTGARTVVARRRPGGGR